MTCDYCEEGEVVMINSARLGRQRPYCTGCGNPLEEDES